MPIEPNDVETTATAEAPSLRDSLSQAFDTTSEPTEAPAVELESAEPREGETQEQADARARDEAGRFTKAPKKVIEKSAPKPAAKPKMPVVEVKPKPLGAPVAVKPGAPVSPAAVPEMKAPQSFRGPAKEAWVATPEAVRVEVLRREKEIATQLQTFGEDRKYAHTMKQAFQPFEAQIRAEGSTPERAIGNLMNTAMLLRTGPPHLKAQAVAEMISTFGVPLDGLVAALEGKAPPAGQPQPQQFDPAAIAKQVQDSLLKELGSKREQALQAKAETEISAFLEAKAMHGLDGTDFTEEIRETMADLMDVAARRKSTLTLEQAYTLAARQHPEVSKVLERQEQAAKAAKANASTQRARAAASSVRSSPATQPVTNGRGNSLREHLEQAAEQLES